MISVHWCWWWGGGARHCNLCLASTCLHFGGFIDSSLTVVACALVVNGVMLLCQLRQERPWATSWRWWILWTLVAAFSLAISRKRYWNPSFWWPCTRDLTISILRMHVTHIGNWDTLSSSKMHMCNLSWQLNDPNWHLPHLLAVFRKLCPYKKAQAEHNTGNFIRKRKMMSSSKWKLNYVWIKWVHLGMRVRGWQWLWLPPINICKAKFYSLIHSDSVVWCGLHLRLVK